MITVIRNEGPAGALRAGVLLLLALGVVGTAATLAYERHWEGFWQMLPWVTLSVVTVATVALVIRVRKATVMLARVVAAVAMMMAIVGTWQHFQENYNTAPLDYRYAEDWDGMSAPERLWTVAGGYAGHVPVTAAGILLPIGLTLALTTVGLGARTPPSREASTGS